MHAVNAYQQDVANLIPFSGVLRNHGRYQDRSHKDNGDESP
jgi:hypothetical protein